VLGSAAYKAFKDAGHDVTGLAHSRITDHLRKLDLTDFPETDAFFEAARPDCELPCPAPDCTVRPSPDQKPEGVIHCAAERKPGNIASDPILRDRFLIACDWQTLRRRLV